MIEKMSREEENDTQEEMKVNQIGPFLGFILLVNQLFLYLFIHYLLFLTVVSFMTLL